MNADEYAAYVRTQARTPQSVMLSARELREALTQDAASQLDGAGVGSHQVTLAVGFTTARYPWHLYLDGDDLVCLTYNEGGARRSEILTVHRGATLPAHVIPRGVAYPELTARCFADTMAAHGMALDFVDFNTARQRRAVGGAVHAKTVEEFDQR